MPGEYLFEGLQELLGIVFYVANQSGQTAELIGSNSPLGNPCNVVKVFLPFLCWIRIWM
jgi:hypothetical protein